MTLPEAVTAYADAQAALEAAQTEAQAAIADGQARVRQAREALHAAIVDEARRGARMRDLVRETGLTREWVRRLLRRNGINAEE